MSDSRTVRDTLRNSKGFTFHKSERLCSRKLLEELIAGGKKLYQPPFRLVWFKTTLPSSEYAQVAFSVPKRNIKSAVTRNRVKRLMREVYRKNKAGIYTLLQSKGEQCALLFSFTGNEAVSYQITEEKLKLLLLRFVEEFKKSAS